jgi:hypothetical protein
MRASVNTQRREEVRRMSAAGGWSVEARPKRPTLATTTRRMMVRGKMGMARKRERRGAKTEGGLEEEVEGGDG